MVRLVGVWVEIDPRKLESLCSTIPPDCAMKLLTTNSLVPFPNPGQRRVRFRSNWFQRLLTVRYCSLLSGHCEITPLGVAIPVTQGDEPSRRSVPASSRSPPPARAGASGAAPASSPAGGRVASPGLVCRCVRSGRARSLRRLFPTRGRRTENALRVAFVVRPFGSG